MPRPDYEADKERYGESDLRIREAGRDPKKLSEAAKQHPDYKGKLEWQGITYDNIGDYQKAIDASGASGRAGHTVGPLEVAAGAALLPKAVATYGLDKTLEVGLGALFPDVQDTVLEQGMRAAKLGTAAKVSKLSRIAYDKILKDTFDFRIPNPIEELRGLFDVGAGMGPRPKDFDSARITNRDIQGPVTNPDAPLPAWLGTKNPLPGEEHIQLAEQVYLDSLKGNPRLKEITNYKLRGSESFEKWAREEYAPLMQAAAKKARMGLEPFYSIIASKPGFKYIEHRIAKRADLQWFWDMVGDPNKAWDVKANDVSNLRLLLDDRFKKLKDVVEFQIYGDSKGVGGINNDIVNPKDRYIVDIQSPNTRNEFIGLNQNAGDVVIKRAGTGQEVGRIGEYYNVLFSSHKDLMQKLPLKFPELKTMSRPKQEKWITAWRKKILQDHLDIIRNKEKDLVGLSPTQKAEKIDQALFDDMAEFREEYKGVLPFMTKGEMAVIRKQMSVEEIENLRRYGRPIKPVKPEWKTTLDEKKARRRGPLPSKTAEREIQRSKLKGSLNINDIFDR